MKKIGWNILKVIGVISLVFLIFVVYRIWSFRTYAMDNVHVENGQVKCTAKKNTNVYEKTTKKFNEVKVSPEKEDEISKVEDTSIYYNGKQIKVGDIYQRNLRYYVQLKEFLLSLSVKYDIHGHIVNINYKNNNVSIDLKKASYTKNNETHDLRGRVLTIKDKLYISINDLENMLNLRDKWDPRNKKIYLFNEKKNLEKGKTNQNGKAALIRIEDVAAGATLGNPAAIEKFKILTDNLYSNGMKFNVAWVPRFKNPKENIDNDFFKNHSMENVYFVNMLDHAIQRGGTIGLHGYTHQHGDEESLTGFEITSKDNSTPQETRNIIENAIKTAKYLNIPVEFWESPHYGATRGQQEIAQEYFKILYEPYTGYFNLNPVYTKDMKNLYVPAPLGYVKDKHGEHIVGLINKNINVILQSLFIHPYKELLYIDIHEMDQNGYVDYTYSEESPMNNIIRALKLNGYTTIGVDKL